MNLFCLTCHPLKMSAHTFMLLDYYFITGPFQSKKIFSQDMSKCFECQRYHRHSKNFSYDNSVHYSSPSIILWEWCGRRRPPSLPLLSFDMEGAETSPPLPHLLQWA